MLPAVEDVGFSKQPQHDLKEEAAMKRMQWLLVLALGAVLGLGAAGCGDDDDGGGSSSLTGTWEATAFNGLPLPADIGMTITLRENGTATGSSNIQGATETYDGTWSATGGTLTITGADGTESMGYTVEGNTLTVTDENGSITLRRQ